MRILISVCLLILILLCPTIAWSQSLPHAEVRAVWLTTAVGLDWPRSTDAREQQESLQRIVHDLKAAHFNTIFFQVRARGDAYYRSRFEPWAENLTGTAGKDPGWDPLAFLLTEAHNAGMEVHAWFNVFKIRGANTANANSFPSPLKKWLVSYAGEGWLDPGMPDVRAYLLEAILDLVQQYDIDGINFDFLRYPDEGFPDDVSYAQYGNGAERSSWRRRNIEQFVAEAYDRITAAKPKMKVGSSPVGNLAGNGEGPPHVVYGQDAPGWMEIRKQDYLSPQIYWNIGATPGDPDFAALTEAWRLAAGVRHMYAGIAAYKPDVVAELPAQIDTARSIGAEGQAFFRLEHIRDFRRLAGRYDAAAAIPPMPWKDMVPPAAPQHAAVTQTAPHTLLVEWLPSGPASDGDSARWYGVFRAASQEEAALGNGQLLDVTPSTHYVDTISNPAGISFFYGITSFDRMNNESLPSPVAGVTLREALAARDRIPSSTSLTILSPTTDGAPPLAAYRLAARTTVTLAVYRELGNGREELLSTTTWERQDRGTYVVLLKALKPGDGPYRVRLVTNQGTLMQQVNTAS